MRTDAKAFCVLGGPNAKHQRLGRKTPKVRTQSTNSNDTILRFAFCVVGGPVGGPFGGPETDTKHKSLNCGGPIRVRVRRRNCVVANNRGPGTQNHFLSEDPGVSTIKLYRFPFLRNMRKIKEKNMRQYYKTFDLHFSLLKINISSEDFSAF